MNQSNMLTGSPGKTLFLFAVPMMIGNLFQQLYNLVDSAVVGKYVGENALAAVGASYSITNVFIAIAIGGGIGSSVIISQYLGAGNIRKMKTSIYTALFNFLGISLFLGVFGAFFHHQILIWMDTPQNVLAEAGIYLKIYFYGLPFLFMYNILASIFNSMGDSKTPLCLLIFSSVLNIFFDLAFVIGLDLGVLGVAVGTLIAQGISSIVSFLLLMRRLKANYQTNGLSDSPQTSDPQKIYSRTITWKMTKIGVPSILQQSIVYIGMLLVQVVVNSFGSSVMAGYTAGMRIESICIVPMTAVGNAMSSFSAQNLGARQPERVKQAYKACYLIDASIAVFLCLILHLFGNTFLSGFLDASSGTEAYSVASAYMIFQSFFYIFIGLKCCTDAILGASGDMLIFTLANLVNLALRVFIANHFAHSWGIQAIWMAVPIGWSINYLISLLRVLTGKWKKIHLI